MSKCGETADVLGAAPIDASTIGVDLGVRNLLVAAPANSGLEIGKTFSLSGEVDRALFNELGAITRRLQLMEADTTEKEAEVFAEYHQWLVGRFDSAIAEFIHWLDQRFDKPLITLEDLAYTNTPLADVRRAEGDAGTWMMPAFQKRLARTLEEEGYEVEYVAPEKTTQECHVCRVHGERRGGKLHCINDGCDVDEVCRDESAAVTIGRRADEAEQT